MSIDLNQAVFTTKYVVEKNSPIIYVSHDEEGDWQFFGAEVGLTSDDARVVSLGEIIGIQPSLKEILWMPAGMQAWFNFDTKAWDAHVRQPNDD